MKYLIKIIKQEKKFVYAVILLIASIVCSILHYVGILSGLYLDIIVTIICIRICQKAIKRFCYFRKSKPEKKIYTSQYSLEYKFYMMVIGLFWLLFYIGCLVTRFIFHFDYSYYIIGVCLLFVLDVIFYTNSKYCVLNQLVNIAFKKKYKKGLDLTCCYVCPVRGWDILMLVSPLLLVMKEVAILNRIFIFITNVLGVICLFFWEKDKKYHLSAKVHHGLCNIKCMEIHD